MSEELKNAEVPTDPIQKRIYEGKQKLAESRTQQTEKKEVQTSTPPEVAEKKEQPTQSSPFEAFKELGYEKEEDIKLALSEYSLTKKERDELKSQLAELEKSKELYEKAKNTNPFVDPDLYRLNKLKQEKPETYEVARKLVFGEMPYKEVLKMQYIQENPEFKDRLDDVELLINERYGLDQEYDLEDPDDVKEQKINLMNLERDAKKARKELLKEFDTIDIPKTVDSEQEKVEAAERLSATRKDNRTKWTPIVDKLIEGFEKIPIHTLDKEGKLQEIMEFKVPAEDKKELTSAVVEYLANNDKPFSEESLREASGYAELLYKRKNEAKIYSELLSYARSLTNEEWAKHEYNPSSLRDKGAPQKSTLTKYEQDRKRVLEKFGVNH